MMSSGGPRKPSQTPASSHMSRHPRSGKLESSGFILHGDIAHVMHGLSGRLCPNGMVYIYTDTLPVCMSVVLSEMQLAMSLFLPEHYLRVRHVAVLLIFPFCGDRGETIAVEVWR